MRLLVTCRCLNSYVLAEAEGEEGKGNVSVEFNEEEISLF